MTSPPNSHCRAASLSVDIGDPEFPFRRSVEISATDRQLTTTEERTVQEHMTPDELSTAAWKSWLVAVLCPKAGQQPGTGVPTQQGLSLPCACAASLGILRREPASCWDSSRRPRYACLFSTPLPATGRH